MTQRRPSLTPGGYLGPEDFGLGHKDRQHVETSLAHRREKPGKPGWIFYGGKLGRGIISQHRIVACPVVVVHGRHDVPDQRDGEAALYHLLSCRIPGYEREGEKGRNDAL